MKTWTMTPRLEYARLLASREQGEVFNQRDLVRQHERLPPLKGNFHGHVLKAQTLTRESMC